MLLPGRRAAGRAVAHLLATIALALPTGRALAGEASRFPRYIEEDPQAPHPVRGEPMLAWHRAVAATMAGPTASPWFRDTATAMDVRWRLLAAGEPLPDPSEAEVERALDLSLQGAVLGLDQVIREALSRSEVLAVAEQVVRTGLRPGIVVQGGPGGPRLSLDDRPWTGRAALAAVSEGPRPGRRPPPPPRARLGAGLRFVEQEAAAAEDDPLSSLSDLEPSLQGWLGLDRVGVEAMTATVSWLSPFDEERPEAEPELWWDLAARQRLLSGVALRAQLSSHDPLLLPDMARVGLLLPLPANERWRISLDGTRRLPNPERASDEGEWRAELRLSANLDWSLPVDVDRWPLGQQPGAPGPLPLALRPRGPNTPSPAPALLDASESTLLAGSAAEQPQREGAVVDDVGVGAAAQP